MASEVTIDYLIILDFEATCDKIEKGKKPYINEIIEFPSVVIDCKTMKMIEKLEQFVLPSHNAHLTDFCKKLTGITQKQVDNGIPLKDAFKMHQMLIGKYNNSIIVTCGDWDLKTMLPADAHVNNFDIPNYYKRWINIKIPFMELYKIKKSYGMEDMLSHLKLKLLGHHHSGIDDCINIGQIAIQMLKDGWKPCSTSS